MSDGEDTPSRSSILEMAAAAKKLVADVSWWVSEIQNLPVEEAKAEYAASLAGGDELLVDYQESAPDEQFIRQMEFSERKHSAAERLLVKAIQLSQFAFYTVPPLRDGDRLILNNCAYGPDFSVPIGSTQLRSGFEISQRLVEQVDEFLQYVCATDVKVASTFQSVLDACLHDRREARSLLPSGICVATIQRMIDYETCWLLNRFYKDPEPQRWAPSNSPFERGQNLSKPGVVRQSARQRIEASHESVAVVASDYSEPITKKHLALMLDVSSRAIPRMIKRGELRVLPGTSNRAKRVRVHIDDLPQTLKRRQQRDTFIQEHRQTDSN